ncbi:MAG: hypothetical protein SGILL_001191 [Bacillariaceae sp.]
MSQPEVLYQEAATALFLAIEEMEWREAFDIIQDNPDQVRTWIRNTGTENTTFDWSVWRRLPIHEVSLAVQQCCAVLVCWCCSLTLVSVNIIIIRKACRRQAPAWLISELISSYPESTYKATNLDELPLHLAVDKACAPEVVNLIIVSNWRAIVTQDQAGRTPLDIIDRGELMQFEDYQIIYDSLSRCHKTYMEVQKAAQEEQAALKRKQKATFSALSKRHQEEMQREQDKQEKLLEAMEALRVQVEDTKEVCSSKDHQIKKHLSDRRRWQDDVRGLENQVAGLKRELESEKGQIKVLLYKIEQKEKEIHDKDSRIEVLSKDLRSIAVSNESDIMECLAETEESMRTMVSNQIALQKLITSKSKDLNSLLSQRGITLPTAKGSTANEEEKKIEHDTDIDGDEVNAAMMAAALAALQHNVD